MKELTQNEAIKKELMKSISHQSASELVNLGDKELSNTFNTLYEQMSYKDLLPQEPTVKSLVQDLYEITTSTFREAYSIIELQDLVFNRVDLLAALLGLELEDC